MLSVSLGHIKDYQQNKFDCFIIFCEVPNIPSPHLGEQITAIQSCTHRNTYIQCYVKVFGPIVL